MKRIFVCVAIFAAFFVFTGFDLDNAIVPQREILSGGPPKDGIPAILEPRLVRPDQTPYLEDADTVIGVIVGAEARAYPIKILNWHEVVNDKISGVPVVVTF